MGTAAGGAEVGTGAGGDRTVELDRTAEAEALSELRALAERGHRFSVLSEEVGLVDLGASFPRVLLDPVDGTRNAKRGLPLVASMLALLDGPELAAARLGFVVNTVSGERWHAVRDSGAFHNGSLISPMRHVPDSRIEILGLETATRELRAVPALIRGVSRLRLLGSTAIALAHTASGGIDVYCGPTRHRLFDMVAGLLMIREVGGVASDLSGASLDELPADLDTLTTVVCSAHPDLHRLALEMLEA
jgi:myo-inositol-1(or 4)-monophosphatase